MVKLYDKGVYLINGRTIIDNDEKAPNWLAYYNVKADNIDSREAIKGTIAYKILQAHNISGNEEKLKIKFDKLISHDITYVSIIQTARASGLEEFKIPYILTNCHNSLCAVGGTINEDDHMFGLSCAKKYGGMYVPPHQAVIHQFAREMAVSSGAMILGSDSHTRYGALGTMGIGEGGPELVKQLLSRTYDIDMPEIVGVYLVGKPQRGVGPQDIALAIIKAVFKNGYVKNKVLEFIGDGVDNLSVDYRLGIDVMTTETTCLTSIWKTDDRVREFYEIHGRLGDYKELKPDSIAYYNKFVYIDLSKIEPMIAMPFHPSNVYTIEELNNNLPDIINGVEKDARCILGDKVKFTLRDKIRNGRLQVEQGVIAGCAGGSFENICDVADILRGKGIGAGEFSLSIYPSSQPVFMGLMRNRVIEDVTEAGAIIHPAFCGPCFGAGDTPCNNGLSIRHTTRNFPNREGSKINNGQIASVALMDARSIAATAINGGYLTSATDIVDNIEFDKPRYYFDKSIYDNRVYNGIGKPDKAVDIKFGQNIKDYPEVSSLGEHLLVKVVSEIHDPVTTTDELIPSGETSSYRSNPIGLAEFTLSRKDPGYVKNAKEVQLIEKARLKGEQELGPEMGKVLDSIKKKFTGVTLNNMQIGSTIYAVRPGDGSAREQAASCQRVLGGCANIASEYATKRYRSNLINWGILPFIYKGDGKGGNLGFSKGDYIFIHNIKDTVQNKMNKVKVYIVNKDMEEIELSLGELTDEEREILISGCLINYYKEGN